MVESAQQGFIAFAELEGSIFGFDEGGPEVIDLVWCQRGQALQAVGQDESAQQQVCGHGDDSTGAWKFMQQ